MSIQGFVRIESKFIIGMCERALALHERAHQRGAIVLAQARKTFWGRCWVFDDTASRDAALAWARERIAELQSAAELSDSVLLSVDDAAWLRKTPR